MNNEHVLTILSQVDTCDLRHFVSVLRSLSYQLITVGNSHSLNYSQWTSDIIKSIKRLIADPKVPAIKARTFRDKNVICDKTA